MDMKSTIGGLAGACTLTLLNETVKRIDKDAPRMDLLGMNAAAKFLKGKNPLTATVGTLMPASLAGDLVANTLYFAMADGDTKKSTVIRGTLLGLGAGIGAVTLPKALGLSDAPTARTWKTRVMTVTWYLLGGLAAAATINLLHKNDRKLTGRV